MTQPCFDFSAPVQLLGSPITRTCSADGARAAGERIARQMVTLLTAYRQYGNLTDAEMSELTGIQRSSVIPRRRTLMFMGLVDVKGMKKNPASGVRNTIFGLVMKG